MLGMGGLSLLDVGEGMQDVLPLCYFPHPQISNKIIIFLPLLRVLLWLSLGSIPGFLLVLNKEEKEKQVHTIFSI